MQDLNTAVRIGLIGDLHGDLGHLLTAVRTMRSRGVRVMIVAGDFGFVWPGVNYQRTLDKISRRLDKFGSRLYFVDGNHEWFPELYSYPVGLDGQRRLRENIIHLPRGYRALLASGRVLAALGGANSIDQDERRTGVDWWPDEVISEGDLASLGAEKVDLLVGHDAPSGTPTLDSKLLANELNLSAEVRAHSLAGRATLKRAFVSTKPSLYVGGHYHHLVDDRVAFKGGDRVFQSRVVLLDEGGREKFYLAIVDVETLSVRLFDGTGRPYRDRLTTYSAVGADDSMD